MVFASSIAPEAVLVPTATTIAKPVPSTIIDLANITEMSCKLSSLIAFFGQASGSPVRSASLVFTSYPLTIIMSAGHFLPFSIWTKSPTTNSYESIVIASEDPLNTAQLVFSESSKRLANLLSAM